VSPLDDLDAHHFLAAALIFIPWEIEFELVHFHGISAGLDRQNDTVTIFHAKPDRQLLRGGDIVLAQRA